MILAMAAMLFSCQKPELTEPDTDLKPGEVVSGEVKVSFTAMLPSAPQTKAMGEDPTSDIESMHLVIFDGNGMYVETREAAFVGGYGTHDSHLYEREFEVTLTVTDQPRIIHFIANCPIGQIVYGHEASIIGNMYVEKDDDPDTPETAYWARIEVPYILVQEVENADGTTKFIPEANILPKFQHIPMLRNYAQVVVKNGTNKNANQTSPFEFIGFTLYNTIDMGTVAPYNNNTQQFQSFVNPDTGLRYKYPALTELNYRGHALAAADLNSSLELDSSNDDGYKWYAPLPEDELSLTDITQSAFFMYERKISVKTNEEDKWSESPPHLIIKGRYDGKVYYYKVDLVYNVFGDPANPEQVTDIEYYNILRNFRYQFTISEVAGPGYDSVQEAINGATSNNLSGSATTTKFTNISDEVGRLWVSYTDTTLVSNNTITLKYKFVPDLDNHEVTNNVVGSGVTFENMAGDVIKSYSVADNDIVGGAWDGFREITIQVKDPQTMTKEQTIVIKSANANLSRDVRYYLKEKYPMIVQCNPKKVAAKIGAEVGVVIKLPVGLTEDMFPLDLEIEVYDMSLSPDAAKNIMPVEKGLSIIPLPEKVGKNSFRFIKSIETKAEYDALPTEGTNKVINTYWLTNVANNGSTVYVYNKYFNVGSDSFVNAKSFNGEFTKGTIGTTGTQTVDYEFDIHAPLPSGMTVTVTLDRLAPIASGSGLTPTDISGVYTYTPSQAGRQTIHLQASSNEEGTCSVSLTTADEFGYADETDAIEQVGVRSYTVNRSIAGTLSGTVTDYQNNNRGFSVTITTGNDTITATGNITRGGNRPNYTYSYTFTINEWEIEYSDPKQIVNVRLRYRTNSNNYYSGTCTVQDLIDGNITGLVLTRE